MDQFNLTSYTSNWNVFLALLLHDLGVQKVISSVSQVAFVRMSYHLYDYTEKHSSFPLFCVQAS